MDALPTINLISKQGEQNQRWGEVRGALYLRLNFVYFIYFWDFFIWILLGSPMLMDPHAANSMQVANMQSFDCIRK